VSFQRVLVSVDEAPIAAHAADVAIELASGLGAKLAFVHVVDPASVAAPDAGIPAGELIGQAEQDAKRLLAGFRQRLSVDVTPLEFVRVGTPATEVVHAAAEWPADVIVIGSHGRRGVTRALLGSVAEAVMRQAPCPVLVVRAHG
jgi:nucleotide-binding universal stress UspA family protein